MLPSTRILIGLSTTAAETWKRLGRNLAVDRDLPRIVRRERELVRIRRRRLGRGERLFVGDFEALITRRIDVRDVVRDGSMLEPGTIHGVFEQLRRSFRKINQPTEKAPNLPTSYRRFGLGA